MQKKVVEECSTQTLRTLQAAEHKLDGQLNVLAANVDRMIRPQGNTSSTSGQRAGEHDALPPELDPDAWVCYHGPNGQSCWHHKALGPPPWNEHSSVDWHLREGVRQQPGIAVGRNGTRARSVDPAANSSRGAATTDTDREFPSWLNGPSWAMPSPEEMPEGWVCHNAADGRTMWHHEALGPAPWNLQQNASIKQAAMNDDMVSTRAPSHGEDEDPCSTGGEGTTQSVHVLRTGASSGVPH